METDQLLNNDVEQEPAAEAPAETVAETSPMYWPVGAVDEGKDDDAVRDAFDSLFDRTSVWD